MNTKRISAEAKEQMAKAIRTRPAPFKASFHGTSTIILDATGHWCVGQVPADMADQIADSMTEAK